MAGPILFYRVRTNNMLLYGKEMDDDENIFRDNRCDLSITHFTYNSRIDCCDPYRRVCNSITILGLVDSSFDIAAYSYCKTNQKLSIAKMRVLIGLLFFFRDIYRLLYEKGDDKHEKEKRDFWINCGFFIDNIYRRTLVNLVTYQIFKNSLKMTAQVLCLGFHFSFSRNLHTVL